MIRRKKPKLRPYERLYENGVVDVFRDEKKFEKKIMSEMMKISPIRWWGGGVLSISRRGGQTS